MGEEDGDPGATAGAAGANDLRFDGRASRKHLALNGFHFLFQPVDPHLDRRILRNGGRRDRQQKRRAPCQTGGREKGVTHDIPRLILSP